MGVSKKSSPEVREMVREIQRERELDDRKRVWVTGDTFEKESLKIRLMAGDGVQVPASQLYYRLGDSFVIGELTYSHAEVQETIINKKGEEELKEYETILPVLVWAQHSRGVAYRELMPYKMVDKIELENHPILIEVKTRYIGTLETLVR